MEQSRLYWRFCSIIVLLYCVGCSVVPVGVPVPNDEKILVADAVRIFLSHQGECPSCIDADSYVQVSKYGRGAGVKGYLHGMAPNFVRFEGVNPLGLTEILTGFDGMKWFWLSVRERSVVAGDQTSQKLHSIFSETAWLSELYYVLIGRVMPGRVTLRSITAAEGPNRYWVTLENGQRETRNHLLFDAKYGRINENIFLREDGTEILHVTYTYAAVESGEGNRRDENRFSCSLPTLVHIAAGGRGELSIGLRRITSVSSCDENEFRLSLPKGFTLEHIP